MKNLYLVQTDSNHVYVIQADNIIEVCEIIRFEDEDELIVTKQYIGENNEDESKILFCNEIS